MKKLSEIIEVKEYYLKNLYPPVRKEQKTDKTFIDDNFPVHEIREPHKPIRSGIGREMVDSPAEQIITSNPQAFIDALKDTAGANDAASSLGKEINQGWIPNLRSQNPNPFKQSVKNPLARGETFLKVSHNEAWVTGNQSKYGLPILFFTPDPMVIFASPEEDDCGWEPNAGVPNKVIVFYERQPLDVISRYPSWTNPKKAGHGKDFPAMVEWCEYWDKDTRYFEADGEAVLMGGVQPNIYKFTPWVRKYSGFGTTSHEGKLEELIVGDLRFVRDLIKQECIVGSNIASILTMFAHRPFRVQSTGEINEDDLREKELGAYSLLAFQNVPSDFKAEFMDVPAPTAEMFAYHQSIIARIQQRSPFIMAGYPFGSSGRQDEGALSAAMKRYDTILENTDRLWSTGFKMAFKIMDTIPNFPMPQGLKKADLSVPYNCSLRLKAEDPIADDRLSTLGDRLWAQGMGSIDLKTNLTKYQKYTEDEAEDIIDAKMVDLLTLQNPDVQMVWGMVAAEEQGMTQMLEEARMRTQQQGQQQQALQNAPPPSTQQRIQGEQQSLGPEVMDSALANRGSRNPPSRFTRQR